jgi:hypothetical protein
MKEIIVRLTVDVKMLLHNEEANIQEVLDNMNYDFFVDSTHENDVSIVNTDAWDYSIIER